MTPLTLVLVQRDILGEFAPAYVRWPDAHAEAEEGLFPVEEESAGEEGDVAPPVDDPRGFWSTWSNSAS